MGIAIYQVDAFTERVFGGNPAAVCVLRQDATEAWMQAVAAEMNLAETAYVKRRADGAFDLCWFTPTVEVQLCGHATLASAHVLWETGAVDRGDAITFHTRTAKLVARTEADRIRLDFPALPVEPCEVPPELSAALGISLTAAYRNANDVGLVELESEQAVCDLAPDFVKLRRTVFPVCIVTAHSATSRCDFVSRFFAPGVGINEDPVTGSAHCSLAPYWAERLNKTEMIGHQLSLRGGSVKVRLRGDRVDLIGRAVTVMRGELTEDARPTP